MKCREQRMCAYAAESQRSMPTHGRTSVHPAVDEAQRDAIILAISERGVGVNVHYIPMAMLSLFKEKGYRISDYPNTYRLYANEISLPIGERVSG